MIFRQRLCFTAALLSPRNISSLVLSLFVRRVSPFVLDRSFLFLLRSKSGRSRPVAYGFGFTLTNLHERLTHVMFICRPFPLRVTGSPSPESPPFLAAFHFFRNIFSRPSGYAYARLRSTVPHLPLHQSFSSLSRFCATRKR